MEWFVILLFALVIIGLPVFIVRYSRYKSDRKYLRLLDQNIKNELLSGESRGAIADDVMAMVRSYIIRQHLLWAAAMTAVFGVCALLSDKMMIVCGAVFCCFVIVRMLMKLHGLSDTESLIKVKAFVFRSRSTEAAAVYYDMQRLEYRTYTQSTVFDDNSRAAAGKYVYLIIRKKESRYQPIMILQF